MIGRLSGALRPKKSSASNEVKRFNRLDSDRDGEHLQGLGVSAPSGSASKHAASGKTGSTPSAVQAGSASGSVSHASRCDGAAGSGAGGPLWAEANCMIVPSTAPLPKLDHLPPVQPPSRMDGLDPANTSNWVFSGGGPYASSSSAAGAGPSLTDDKDLRRQLEEAKAAALDAEVNARVAELRAQALEAQLRAERDAREASVRDLTVRLARAEARADRAAAATGGSPPASGVTDEAALAQLKAENDRLETENAALKASVSESRAAAQAAESRAVAAESRFSLTKADKPESGDMEASSGGSSPASSTGHSRTRRKSTRTSVIMSQLPESFPVVIDDSSSLRKSRGRVGTGHVRINFKTEDIFASDEEDNETPAEKVNKVIPRSARPDRAVDRNRCVSFGHVNAVESENPLMEEKLKRTRERVPTGITSEMQDFLKNDTDEPDDDAPVEKSGDEDADGVKRVPRGQTSTGSWVNTWNGSAADVAAGGVGIVCDGNAGGTAAPSVQGGGGPASVSTSVTSSRRGSATGTRQRRSVDLSGMLDTSQCKEQRRKSCIPNISTLQAIEATREEAEKAPEDGDGAMRRARKKTQSQFAPLEVVEQVCAENGHTRGVEPACDQAKSDKEDDEVSRSAALQQRNRAGQQSVLMDPEEHNDHLACLERYGVWQRNAARGSGKPYPEFREPIGRQRRGFSAIGEADVALLSEAMPLVLGDLGLDPPVLAHCFRAFAVEAGEQLWREDSLIEHIVILGPGACLSLSRAGRPLRDVGAGQCLGSEALEERRPRWQYTATTRRAGEVWFADPVALQALRRAISDFEEPARAAMVLEKAPAFMNALPLQRLVLAAHAEVVTLRKEECLFRNGQAGNHYFVLAEGTLEVVKERQVVRRLTTTGQSFGERALMDGVRRSASVIAAEISTIVALPAAIMSLAFGKSLELFLQRSIVRQVLHDKHGPAGDTLSMARSDTLEAWAQNCVVTTLAPREQAMEREGLSGLIIVLEGELNAAERGADKPFSVGEFQVLGKEHLCERPSEWLQEFAAGDSGADIATLPVAKHRDVFEHCSKFSELVAYQRRVALVREVFIFRHLSEGQCSKLVKSMTMKTMRKGEEVISEGDKGAEFFIIHEGEVSISKNKNFITKLSQPAYFGERALLHEEPRAATVTVSSEQATFCVLSKKAFIEVLHTGILDFIAYRNKLLDTDLQFADLVEEKIIGRGGYGIVKLVSHSKSGTRYALKCVTRQRLNDQDRSLVQRERAVLQLIDHPFAIKIVRSFKDINYVYFLTELVTGGELLGALDVLDVLDQTQAQFYLGSLLVVFDYIHEKNIVYRDLKPENVLLDQDGFIKIIDFGAARKLDTPNQKCYTLLGTPQFMAYEMVLGSGYGMSADIWAMGVCLFEFMVGRLPFDGDQAVHIFRQVASSKPVRVPECVDPRSADMLRWLLQKNPAERVQANQKGYQQMREHPFFHNFAFDELINRSITPPYVPPAEQYSDEASNGAFEDLATLGGGERIMATSVDDWDADF